jgi:hypothetical protein
MGESDLIVEPEQFQFIEPMRRGGQAEIQLWSRNGVDGVAKG